MSCSSFLALLLVPMLIGGSIAGCIVLIEKREERLAQRLRPDPPRNKGRAALYLVQD